MECEEEFNPEINDYDEGGWYDSKGKYHESEYYKNQKKND